MGNGCGVRSGTSRSISQQEKKSRRGKFYILWYRGNQKVFVPVPTLKEEALPELKAALLHAKIKQPR
jgi:hypothetical protein